MDNIEVKLSKFEIAGDEVEPSFSEMEVNMYINGVHIDQAVYAYELLQPTSGKYEIFTCGCGIAGCAGIWDEVSVKFRKHTVEWRIPRDAGYDFLDKKFYSFSRENWNAMCNSIRSQIKELAAQGVQDQFSHWPDVERALYNRLKKYGVK